MRNVHFKRRNRSCLANTNSWQFAKKFLHVFRGRWSRIVSKYMFMKLNSASGLEMA